MNGFVSIVIPIYNEEKHIAECVGSLVAQTFSKDNLEIYLIDGLSEDRTRDLIGTYAETYPYIKVLDNPKRSVPAALNTGIKAAQGDIIIRMDAHTYYDNQYVQKCVETLHTVDACNVGGPITTLPGDSSTMAEAIALATSHPFGVGNSKFRTSQKAQYVDTVPFGAFRREIFEKVGLFNEALVRNQDIELNTRIRKSGGKIYLNPEIKSYYYNQATLTGLWKQNFKNGMWNIFTHVLCKTHLSLRHYIPFLFVMSLAISAILALYSFAGVALFFLIVTSYLACNLLFSFQLGRRRNIKITLLLPLVFFTLHVSYGLGSLFGLIKLPRWKRRTVTQCI